MMLKPASGKCTPMMRRATLPMESISSVGENIPSSVSGMSSKSAQPTHMMPMAVKTVRRTVLRTRSNFCAPKLYDTMGTIALLRPKHGMKMKLWSLK